ncbi:transposable element Tc1 transposase [Trichonephila clavipes]|nr:transposable element Tc1 transposase [Trichonephila clavipes]
MDPKVVWAVAAETTGAGGWRIFPSPPVPSINCGGGDWWCRYLSCRSPTCLRLWQLSFLLIGKNTATTTTFGLAIYQNDHQARRRFVEWAQNEIAVVPDFQKRILFSDEAHFWLNGYVNKQNCRIWSEANPQVYVETPLHPEKLTVWCALWAGGIIGPYFFKNDEGHNVTVNGDRYRAMMTNFFIPELNNHDVQELWFQQDGATCHTARATIDLLKDTFGDRLISRFGPVNWPPRSCDLTPLDYFLWGYVKSLVYADKPQTLDHLEDNIRRVIADIRPQMLEKVIENWTSRLDYIRASRGSPMPDIIFKM